MCVVILVLEGWGQEGSWDPVAGQPRLMGECQVNDRPCHRRGKVDVYPRNASHRHNALLLRLGRINNNKTTEMASKY